MFLAQINFLRLHAACAAYQRPFARAGFESRFFIFILVLGMGNLFFNGRCGVREPPDERATGNFDDEIRSGVAVHALAQAVLAVRGDEARLVILANKIVQVVNCGVEFELSQNGAVGRPSVRASRQ